LIQIHKHHLKNHQIQPSSSQYFGGQHYQLPITLTPNLQQEDMDLATTAGASDPPSESSPVMQFTTVEALFEEIEKVEKVDGDILTVKGTPQIILVKVIRCTCYFPRLTFHLTQVFRRQRAPPSTRRERGSGDVSDSDDICPRKES